MERRILHAIRLGLAAAAFATAAVAAPSECGRDFGAPPRPPVESGGVTITALGCARESSSPAHCLGFAPEDAREIVVPGPAEPARAYRLWLRVGTGADAAKLRVALNGAAAEWWVPPTPAFGWQLVTRPDGKARPFTLHAGENRLRLDGAGQAVTVTCGVLAADPAFIPDVRAVHRLDQAWSGVGVLFDAVGDGRVLYVGYYDAHRVLTVAAFDRAARAWRRRALDSVFDGWDNHNAVALALDRAGNLHVAGNMHASPLVYGRTSQPGRIDDLRLTNAMTGADEARATYPTWIDAPDGLAFLYRSGVSGAGDHVLNRFDGAAWSRLGARIFAAPRGQQSASAYPTPPRLGPDGAMHMAWIWRRTPDAVTSFQVGYARSRDLRAWAEAAGRPVALPIAPGAAIVDDVPERSGLSTAPTLGFDRDGRPVVSYLKDDAAGVKQLYNARWAGAAWQVVQVSDWRDRWVVEGHGTVPALIRFGEVRVEADGALVQSVRHWRAGRFDYVLDPATLKPAGRRASRQPLPAALLRVESAEPGMFAIAIPARVAGAADDAFVLRWEAQASDRDRQPPCTAERPRACNPPPSALMLVERR